MTATMSRSAPKLSVLLLATSVVAGCSGVSAGSKAAQSIGPVAYGGGETGSYQLSVESGASSATTFTTGCSIAGDGGVGRVEIAVASGERPARLA